MFCHVFWKEARSRKKNIELKIFEWFLSWSSQSQMYTYLLLVQQTTIHKIKRQIICYFTNLIFVKLECFFFYVNIAKNYLKNSHTKNLIQQALMIWGFYHKSYKQMITWWEKSDIKVWWITKKILKKCWTENVLHIYGKLFYEKKSGSILTTQKK